MATSYLLCKGGYSQVRVVEISGVARPGPTRACALPSTSQALPSPGQQDSRDSSMNAMK